MRNLEFRGCKRPREFLRRRPLLRCEAGSPSSTCPTRKVQRHTLNEGFFASFTSVWSLASFTSVCMVQSYQLNEGCLASFTSSVLLSSLELSDTQYLGEFPRRRPLLRCEAGSPSLTCRAHLSEGNQILLSRPSTCTGPRRSPA